MISTRERTLPLLALRVHVLNRENEVKVSTRGLCSRVLAPVCRRRILISPLNGHLLILFMKRSCPAFSSVMVSVNSSVPA